MQVLLAKPSRLGYNNDPNHELLHWTQKQADYYEVDLQYIHNVDMLSYFPDYEYGIGYLFEQKIPAIEFTKNKHWLNFHPGPLPEMGGRNLAYHAILHNMKQFGATIHWMDENFDTGPIIECQRFDIEKKHTAEDLVRISHDILENLFRKYIPMLFRGELNRWDYQARETITYYKRNQIINRIPIGWDTERLIRALYCPPYYPYVVVGGKRYKLVQDGEFLDE